ncbi:glycosyltransferase [Streptococcus suis]|uniref:glycosyltransferase n=1 Tax=Streptococcus parasuis TaxID=1501662 RepID=UPI0015545814|nr:glycosyltransferase [Streptococcus suis]WNF86760.1 glycosyltransferase [Streptococcus parasuis]
MSHNHTFVICAYGDSRYLEECIQSLVNQTLKTDIILYTSTPSNYIEGLCEKYDISVFSSVGGSIGKDWNNALSFVQTQYATIVHQDDIYLSDYAKKVLSSVADDTLIAYSDYQEVKDGNIIPLTSNLKIKHLMLRTMAIFPKWKFWRNRVLAFGNPISCPAVTYNLKNLNDFKFNEEMKVSLDWFAWYQIAQKKGSFIFVDESLMYHRIHEESETTNSIENNDRTKEDYEMYLLFWPKVFAKLLLKFYVKSQDTNG